MPRDSNGHLTPGIVAPARRVPSHIPRPEYVGNREPATFTGSDNYDNSGIARIRESGRIAAEAIALVGTSIRVGMTTDDLDGIGHAPQ